MPALRYRLSGWFWDLSPFLLSPLRRIKRALALLRYRFRSLRRPLPPRVASDSSSHNHETPLTDPAVVLHVPVAADPRAAERFLAGQTETSVTLDPAAEGAGFFVPFHEGLEVLPATWLESQLLVAVAQDLAWTTSGWAPPQGRRTGSTVCVHVPKDAVPGFVRLPAPEIRQSGSLLGCAVPHVTVATRMQESGLEPACDPLPAPRSGPYFLRHDVRSGSVVRRRLVSLRTALRRLAAVQGPRTALFLLPFLAVGGAEKLLFDLFEGLDGRYRLLVVTLEPHREELGQTLDEARRLTPYVYTLGDWLPREAHRDALEHLIRRYAVATLVSWNGTVLFYEAAAGLKRRHPELRIVNQLFNHEGGWIAHYGPRLVRSVDLHIAVNRRIGRALDVERGVPAEGRVVIHHGVRIPAALPADVRAARRRHAREELGLPPDAVIAGSFMRLHPQKRPFDVLRLARLLGRQGEAGFHFLLVGGGPLDEDIDRQLEARPLGNLTRLPLRRDVEVLYDAVDLCLLPSAYEGLPVFLLEGLARGLPCVATAVGDVPYLLRGGGGLVLDRVGDIPALAHAVLSFGDPERRRTEGERGRAAVARRFALDRYVKAYESALFPEPGKR